jgi:hypothetical protein
MVEPVDVRFISTMLPGMVMSWAHFPAILAGPTVPEHPLANSAGNHTNITERIVTSGEGFVKAFNLPR